MHFLLKTILSVLIIIFFTKISTFAMSHSATYEMDGKITFGNIGTSQSQTTIGEATMTKESSINISSGVIDIIPNDYAHGETSITNITNIELCAPPRYTYETEDGEVIEIKPEFIFKRSGYTGPPMTLEKTTSMWNNLF